MTETRKYVDHEPNSLHNTIPVKNMSSSLGHLLSQKTIRLDAFLQTPFDSSGLNKDHCIREHERRIDIEKNKHLDEHIKSCLVTLVLVLFAVQPSAVQTPFPLKSEQREVNLVRTVCAQMSDECDK